MAMFLVDEWWVCWDMACHEGANLRPFLRPLHPAVDGPFDPLHGAARRRWPLRGSLPGSTPSGIC